MGLQGKLGIHNTSAHQTRACLASYPFTVGDKGSPFTGGKCVMTVQNTISNHREGQSLAKGTDGAWGVL